MGSLSRIVEEDWAISSRKPHTRSPQQSLRVSVGAVDDAPFRWLRLSHIGSMMLAVGCRFLPSLYQRWFRTTAAEFLQAPSDSDNVNISRGLLEVYLMRDGVGPDDPERDALPVADTVETQWLEVWYRCCQNRSSPTLQTALGARGTNGAARWATWMSQMVDVSLAREGSMGGMIAACLCVAMLLRLGPWHRINAYFEGHHLAAIENTVRVLAGLVVAVTEAGPVLHGWVRQLRRDWWRWCGATVALGPPPSVAIEASLELTRNVLMEEVIIMADIILSPQSRSPPASAVSFVAKWLAITDDACFVGPRVLGHLECISARHATDYVQLCVAVLRVPVDRFDVSAAWGLQWRKVRHEWASLHDSLIAWKASRVTRAD